MQFYDLVEEDPFSSSVHFETQREALCGLHCLNNCLGGPHLTRTGMEKAVQILLEPLYISPKTLNPQTQKPLQP